MIRPPRRVLATALLLLLASCGSGSDRPATSSPTPSPTIGASHHGKIDVLGAVLVMNDDGSATLSARIVNHTDLARQLGDVTLSDLDAYETFPVRFFSGAIHAVEPGATTTIGGAQGPLVRIARGVEPGATVPLDLRFDLIDDYDGASPEVLLKVPVIARSATYDSVAGNKPNTAITVKDARITVLRGQRKAYVDGTVVSTIDDVSYELPTAVDVHGKPVPYEHQTATGGPYGLSAQKGKRTEIGGGPPYTEGEGDADYFNAKDVKVGETITVTIPFQSGDVVAPFKVVAG